MNYTENRKAFFDYEIIDEYEAGIELFGFEVKAIKNGKANLSGSFAVVRGGEIYALNTKIEPYQTKNTPIDYNPKRNRKLLLSKKEIKEVEKYEDTKGLTIIPISLYNKKNKIKMRLAICRGKKLHDKRESIKKRDLDREIKRGEN